MVVGGLFWILAVLASKNWSVMPFFAPPGLGNAKCALHLFPANMLCVHLALCACVPWV